MKMNYGPDGDAYDLEKCHGVAVWQPPLPFEDEHQADRNVRAKHAFFKAMKRAEAASFDKLSANRMANQYAPRLLQKYQGYTSFNAAAFERAMHELLQENHVHQLVVGGSRGRKLAVLSLTDKGEHGYDH